MRKLFFRLFVFAILFIVIDQAIGFGLSTLVLRAKGGDTGRNNVIANSVKADIVLFGSSRCDHHYDPRIFTDSTGMSCYNAGHDGNGILMLYPYYKMMASRYTPKLIIYDLSSFDVAKDDYSKYLQWLRQFYGRPVVDSMVWDINPREKYKMVSQAYRYNGKALQIVADAIHPMQKDILGFKPLSGVIKHSYEKDTASAPTQIHIDPFKQKYLLRLITDCKHSGTKIVFVVSPTYGQQNRSAYFRAISDMCRRNNVPLLYYQTDRRFIHNPQYFSDKVHLNATGADAYTKTVVSEMREMGLL